MLTIFKAIPRIKADFPILSKSLFPLSYAIQSCILDIRKNSSSTTQITSSNNPEIGHDNLTPIGAILPSSSTILKDKIHKKKPKNENYDSRIKRYLFADLTLTQEDIDGIIMIEVPTLNNLELAQFLYLAARFSKKNREVEILPRHLVLIRSCISRFPTSCWTGKDVAFIMTSLQSVRGYDPGVNNMLILMTSIINESLEITEMGALRSSSIAMIMYGLRYMSSDSIHVRALLSALVPKVQNCTEIFKPREFSNVLYGMQGMKCDSTEVCAMLSALVPKVQNIEDRLSAQEIGNALYGVQGMITADAYLPLISLLHHQTSIITTSPWLLKAIPSKDLEHLRTNVVLTLDLLRVIMSMDYSKGEGLLEKYETVNVSLADELHKRKLEDDIDSPQLRI
mmetsp:Transcript_34757/g.33078  ORF Transcript_34757/g.33078 Transcript_34757/m.33078 type:complete len:396 (+) Transcript_34757:122-1309(+)